MEYRRILIAIAVVQALLSAFVLGCGGDDGSDIESLATEAADVQPQAAFTITAEDIEFDTDTIVAPAGQEFTLTFNNQDSGVAHNVAVYSDEDASEEILRGELFQGVETRDYVFTAPEAGVYYFRCDAHPDMNGAFITK